jgi:hypothetical protein
MTSIVCIDLPPNIVRVLAYIYFTEDNQGSTFTIVNAGGKKPQVTVQKSWHRFLLTLLFG